MWLFLERLLIAGDCRVVVSIFGGLPASRDQALDCRTVDLLRLFFTSGSRFLRRGSFGDHALFRSLSTTCRDRVTRFDLNLAPHHFDATHLRGQSLRLHRILLRWTSTREGYHTVLDGNLNRTTFKNREPLLNLSLNVWIYDVITGPCIRGWSGAAGFAPGCCVGKIDDSKYRAKYDDAGRCDPRTGVPLSRNWLLKSPLGGFPRKLNSWPL